MGHDNKINLIHNFLFKLGKRDIEKKSAFFNKEKSFKK
jgi:hypothetical protein